MTMSPGTWKRPSSTQLLARILETPDLPARVAALEPPALAGLIERIGLEDAGELVAFATTEQLAHVFDEDLWKSDRPGEDERFDSRRFVLWLEVMLEGGDDLVAKRIVELPEDLVTLAFHEEMLVLRLEDLLVEMREMDPDEADGVEKALSNCLYEEIDEYQIVARHHEGWDAVLATILALDRDRHEWLARLLERCRRLSAGRIDDEGGLYEVLTAGETLAEDVAAAREDRRAEAGHVAPSAAAAFLRHARGPIDARKAERDPLTSAYFRDLGKAGRSLPATAPSPTRSSSTIPGDGWLSLPAGPGASAPPAAEETLLARALRELAAVDPEAMSKRTEEIAYVANVLAAGCSFEGRRMRPVEATRAALTLCNLGLELSSSAAARRSPSRAAATLARHPADILFRVAWSHVHRDVPASVTAAYPASAIDAALGKR
jgi:hypothetical protein